MVFAGCCLGLVLQALQALTASCRQDGAEGTDARQRDEAPTEAIEPRRFEREHDGDDRSERHQHNRDVHEQRMGRQAEQLFEFHADHRTPGPLGKG